MRHLLYYTYASLGVLVGLVTTSSAQGCDPNHYQEPIFGQETPQDPSARRKLLEYYADLSCIEMSDGSEPNVKEQCKNVCPAGEDNGDGKTVVSSQSCIFNGAPWLDRTTGALVPCGEEKSHNGVLIRKGYCTCNLPILEFAGTFFIQAVTETGRILEKVVCPLLKALDVVMAIGMAAIPPPGRAITGGMVAVIRSAKAYKYAYEAQDAAKLWADFFLSGADFAGQAGCGLLMPKKADLIKRAFGPLTDVVDEVVPGGMNYDKLTCPAKGCRGCKGPKCRGNNHDENGNSGSPGSKTMPGQTATSNGPGITEQPTKSTGTLATSSVATFTFAPTLSTLIRSSVITTNSPSVWPSASSVSFSSSSQPVSSSSSFLAATPSSLSCEALAALDTEEGPTELRKRVYPIDVLQRDLEKRAAKSGQACGITLSSFDFPSSGKWDDHAPQKYGFNVARSCDDYGWDNPDPTAKYETEHVLEWQVVVTFFNAMNKEIKGPFHHPNPEKNSKVGFCEYWRESWEFKRTQVMSGPEHSSSPTPSASPTPANGPNANMEPKEKKETPFKLIAREYPYRNKRDKEQMWLEEMTLLEKSINANAKGRIFDLEKKTDGEYSDIRSKKKMEDLAKGISRERQYKNLDAASQARAAVLNLRQTIGTFKYMQDKKVAKIFADQKNRMGAIIGYIDNELHKTPRMYYPTGRDPYSAKPWVEQGLQQKWNKYMDDGFELAKKRATDYMELHLGNLDAAWNSQSKKDEYKENNKDDKATKEKKEKLKQSHKEVLDLIDKCRKEWDKVKDWKKPDNWSEDKKTDDGSDDKESDKQPADGDKNSQPGDKGTDNP